MSTISNTERNRRIKQAKQSKLDAAKASRLANEAFIASLPQATEAQLRKLVSALKSDSVTASSVGFNVTFKVTTKNGLKRIANAKTARVNAINKAPKKTEIKNAVNSDSAKFESFKVQHAPKKDSKGEKRTMANLRFSF